MVSCPTDVEPLDVEQEQAKLEEALSEVTQRGAVEIHWLERATLSALSGSSAAPTSTSSTTSATATTTPEPGTACCCSRTSTGASRRVSGSHLGTMLADETTLRLAVLNACEGARTSVDRSLRGRRREPRAARDPRGRRHAVRDHRPRGDHLREEFYAAIADGYAVDASLAEARKAIFAERQRDRMGDAGALHARRPTAASSTSPTPALAPTPSQDLHRRRRAAPAAASTTAGGVSTTKPISIALDDHRPRDGRSRSSSVCSTRGTKPGGPGSTATST